MADIGRWNSLKVISSSALGAHLDGGEHGELLLPSRLVPRETEEGDHLDVFVYLDSEDRPVATTAHPLVTAGEFAGLQVVEYQPGMGAWLHWGLDKDLLLPLREQAGHVEAGDIAVVFVRVDERSGRLVATMRLDRHLDLTEPHYTEGQCVDLLVSAETPLGWKAVVNNAHGGLLYRAEVGVALSLGQRLAGYVKALRPDGKLDLSLDPSGYQRVKPLAQLIMEALKAGGGELELDDKSPPEEVRERFGVSKKAFKQALGALYRDRHIVFAPPGVKLAARNVKTGS